MIFVRLGFLFAVMFVMWFGWKLLRSPKFDKICDDLVEGNLDTDPTSKDTMKNIGKEETALGKQAEQNTKQAKKLETESSNINEFLGDRGVTEVKKEGGSE